jgi:outer membrane protein OmpA-like peptidoglycan-associated protein
VLSENRAKACYKWLVDKGIDPRRIVPVGKGEAIPAKWIDPATGQEIVLTEAYINQFKKTDPAKFEKLHQLNRRTEGRVINMLFDPATAPVAPATYLQFLPIPKK